MKPPPETGTVFYCSSVSPQPAVAGELLVYRHLSRLRGRGVAVIAPEEKPPGTLEGAVALEFVPRASIWLWRLRRGWMFPVADRLLAGRIIRVLRSLAARVPPAVVVTTFLPDGFLTAAATFARRNRLPLVLICHDDYEDMTPRSFHGHLGAVYRQAAVRLCVSAVMEAEFTTRYGVPGTVLLPIPSGPARRPAPGGDGPPRIGFAGSIGAGYSEALARLADAAGRVGGQVVVASPTARNPAWRLWSHPAVRDLGRAAPDEVAGVLLGAGVNVLAVVQSFDAQDERAFRFNFPSKLTEYATYGLPLLIVAPASASAVWWATRHGEAAVLATDSAASLELAIGRLADAAARNRLAQAFHEAAAEFDPERLQTRFEEAIETAITDFTLPPARF